MMRRIADLCFKRQLARQTTRYLDELTAGTERASQEKSRTLIENIGRTEEPLVSLGQTEWQQRVAVPISTILRSHAVVTGGSGSGKTCFALGIATAFIDRIVHDQSFGFGVLDAKGDLFVGVLGLLAQRLDDLARTDAGAATALRNRIVIVDFSSNDPISSYNILVRSPVVESGYFAESRADLLLDLLASGDALSLGGTAILRRSLLILSECELPITWLSDFLQDEVLRTKVLRQCRDVDLTRTFERQFAATPKQTVAALSRRMDALFASETVRLALSGTTAPDFRSLQEDGRIVLVNCFGPNLSRTVRRLLQGIVLADITQSVFARRNRSRPFLWLCDEAQNFFLTSRLREHITDLLTMARSFGTFLMMLTQNLSAAIHDPRLLQTVITNVRWTMSMRGEVEDAAFLKPILPVSGRKVSIQYDPFKEPGFLSIGDERSAAINEIANLPDRTGYLWLRTCQSEAIKILTEDLRLPGGERLQGLVHRLRDDSKCGGRVSRKQYDDELRMREKRWSGGDAETCAAVPKLADAYKKSRGRPQ